MKLINKVSINYFRSVYDGDIKKLNDLNIFAGNNDSGKSNILRALNLFFNNETDPDNKIDFLKDVTNARQAEAREVKGRLTIWMKIDFNNVNNWKSLPKSFSIKKVWNRDAQLPDVSYDAGIDAQAITRFVNKIAYHYVPAVKHRDIYGFYLKKLYETISANSKFDILQPSIQLSQTINQAISQLSKQIRDNVGISSVIDIPSDFGDLFQKLNFETTDGEFKVELNRRGDGIQARHLPHLIDHISQNNGKLNVWAYEEPENSLEMLNSLALADEFKKEFSKTNQIFITTHSPSFYGLDGDNVKKFFVRKDVSATKPKSIILSLEDEIADDMLGIKSLIIKKSAALYKEITELSKFNAEILKDVCPIVLTEGTTDSEIFSEAWRRIANKRELGFMPCEPNLKQGGGYDTLAKLLQITPHLEQRIRIGVFDRDKDGSAAFNNLKNFKIIANTTNFKKRDAGNIYAMILPDHDWDYEHFDKAGRPVAIEQLFHPDVIGRQYIKVSFATASQNLSLTDAKLLLQKLEQSDFSKLVKTSIKIENKPAVANIIKAAPDKAYEKVFHLLETMYSIITN